MAAGSEPTRMMNAYLAIRPSNCLLAAIAFLLHGWTVPSFAAHDPSGAGPDERASTPELRIEVDPSVELVSLLFRLAGNPEYSHCRVPSYATDVDKRFKSSGSIAASIRASRARRGCRSNRSTLAFRTGSTAPK